MAPLMSPPSLDTYSKHRLNLYRSNSTAFAATATYAFVIKDARQYLNMANLVQVYEGETLVEQPLEPAHDVRFDKRIVYGFLKGSFAVAEMNSFFEECADCAGVAPKADVYFELSTRAGRCKVAGSPYRIFLICYSFSGIS